MDLSKTLGQRQITRFYLCLGRNYLFSLKLWFLVVRVKLVGGGRFSRRMETLKRKKASTTKKKDIMKNRLITTERSFFSSAKIVIFSLRS